MIANRIRAVATALVLGTAAMAVATMPADAAMRSAVGKPLQEAVSLAKSGNYAAAMAQVKKAEAVGGLSAEETKGVNQMKEYLASVSKGQVGTDTATGAIAKFNADWNARKYRDVIADEDLLRQRGALSGAHQVVVAQAYEGLGDYRGCMRYADSHAGAGAEMVRRGMLCAFKAGDDTAARNLAIKLVSQNPTPDNWGELLKQAEHAKQLSDPQTLDIYRLKFLTGNLKGSDEYFMLSQMLIAARVQNEAAIVVDKGVQAKLLVDARAQRLAGMAKKNAADENASVQKALAAAQKQPKGEDLIKAGEVLSGMGRYGDAVNAIQAGIGKGVVDTDNAQVRLAVALYGNKQKPAAMAALDKVIRAAKTPNGKLIATMWSLYIKSH
jgi:hypothetical protein